MRRNHRAAVALTGCFTWISCGIGYNAGSTWYYKQDYRSQANKVAALASNQPTVPQESALVFVHRLLTGSATESDILHGVSESATFEESTARVGNRRQWLSQLLPCLRRQPFKIAASEVAYPRPDTVVVAFDAIAVGGLSDGNECPVTAVVKLGDGGLVSSVLVHFHGVETQTAESHPFMYWLLGLRLIRRMPLIAMSTLPN